MVLDCHIHIFDNKKFEHGLPQKLKAAGIDGAVLLSLPPPSFEQVAPSGSPSERIENVLEWCSLSESLYPFYWIDPLEEDAPDQVELAVEKGINGFKIICDCFYPGDERAMNIYRAISQTKRPILFHSGILWDGKPSSKYNRPVEFEALLQVSGLRFALAHISWPWCDELIAVYGKFLDARRHNPEMTCEFFIDTTPGTPPIYRKEALTKLLTVGYDVKDNIIFGSDSSAGQLDANKAKYWIEQDSKIFRELDISKDTQSKIFSENLKRFIWLPRTEKP